MLQSRVLDYLHRYVWMPVTAESVVVDFIRQARLGEGPRLLVYGMRKTGKTRLAMALMALLDDLVLLDNLGFTGRRTRLLAESNVLYPVIATTNNRTLAQIWASCPVIYLPVVSIAALREAGIPAAVSADELIENADAVWSSL